MRRLLAIATAAALASACGTTKAAASADLLGELDAALSAGDPGRALELYADAAKDARDPEALLAYAYTLALAGLHEPALAYLDRAAARAPPALPCVAGAVFALAGESELAAAFSPKEAADCPDWLTPHQEAYLRRFGRPPSEPKPMPPGDAAVASKEASERSSHDQHFQAVWLLRRVVATSPDAIGPRVGYSIELERAGAIGLATQQTEEAIGFSPDEEIRGVLAKRLGELREKQAALGPGAAGLYQRLAPKTRGRFLAYFGGNISSGSAGTFGGVNSRGAWFFLPGKDVGVDLGVNYASVKSGSSTSQNTLLFNLGLSSRAWWQIGAGPKQWFVQGGLELSVGGPTADVPVTAGAGLSIPFEGVSSADTFDLMVQGQVSPFTGAVGLSVLVGTSRFFGQ